MKRLLIAASLLGLLFPSVALAQQDGATTETEKVTEFEFEGIDVEASHHVPPGERITPWHDGHGESVYQTRQNFVPELLDSTREF
ncbi:MAG: hypothetical protein ACLFVJ_19795 [Persicimonas sp.]